MRDEEKTKEQLINELVELRQKILSLEKIETERKRSEEALRASERRYSALIENSPDILYILDHEGLFSFIGGAVKSLLGFTLEEVIGKHFTFIVWPEDINKAQWRLNERRTGERATKKLEIRLKTKQGRKKYFDIRYLTVELYSFGMYNKPVSAKDKKFFGTYGVARDITERKQVEENLKYSNKELRKEQGRRKLLSKRLIYLLEKNRHQIAMELHDQIGQTLTSLKIDLEMIRSDLKLPEAVLEGRIKSMENKVVQAIRDTKHISQGLRPSILDNLGLIPSLRELFDDIEREGHIKIHFFSRNVSKRFNKEIETAVYRIIQEAMTNIIKHSRAKEVHVNLIKKDKLISLSVEDDGVGFELAEVMKYQKERAPLGLLIIEERTIQLGGEFHIQSRIGRGTHILLEIPL